LIFGYIATNQYPDIEKHLRKATPKAGAFEFDLGDRRAFFLQSGLKKYSALNYRSENRLLLVDGLPVRHSSEGGYEVIDRLVDKDLQSGFTSFVDSVVSNVSMIFFEKADPGAKVTLSSSRAGPGKIYYRNIAGGIAFSTDFTTLLKFGPVSWDSKAVYYIIRYGYSPPPFTISKDVQAVPNAHWAGFDTAGKGISVWPYFRFDFSQANGSDLSQVDGVLDQSADILGSGDCSLLLSGGIDSTLFAHKMRQRSKSEIRGYYLKFGEGDPELPFAEQAARAADCSLKILNMETDVVLDTIMEIVNSYSHPFSDYSTIATYYVMKRAAEYEKEGLIFDGNGGDDCFGLGFWLPRMVRGQRLLFSLPAFAKAVAFGISSRWALGRKNTDLARRITQTISYLNEKEIYQVHLILCPWTRIFEANTRAYDQEMGDLAVNTISDMLKPAPHNESYLAKATVVWMRHVTPGMWCAKTYGIKSLPQLQPVYPYMWKDMLEEQGKISWSAKVTNGIVKWPLKKLLENYMSQDFIYRKKSGFTPPLEGWFENEKLYELLCDTLLSQHTVIERIINKGKLGELLKELPNTRGWPASLSNFLWGCLFTELWVQKNG
jgi:asparagine synthase (glutamine-hydrolysing)